MPCTYLLLHTALSTCDVPPTQRRQVVGCCQCCGFVAEPQEETPAPSPVVEKQPTPPPPTPPPKGW